MIINSTEVSDTKSVLVPFDLPSLLNPTSPTKFLLVGVVSFHQSRQLISGVVSSFSLRFLFLTEVVVRWWWPSPSFLSVVATVVEKGSEEHAGSDPPIFPPAKPAYLADDALAGGGLHKPSQASKASQQKEQF